MASLRAVVRGRARCRGLPAHSRLGVSRLRDCLRDARLGVPCGGAFRLGEGVPGEGGGRPLEQRLRQPRQRAALPARLALVRPQRIPARGTGGGTVAARLLRLAASA